MTVVEGRDPFVELRKDVQSIPEQSWDKAMSRVEEVILGAMTKIKVRKLHLENHKVRSTSRSREPDSDEEVKLSKFSKASPLSPSDMGPERESWPAPPPPGAKVALQEVIQAPGGQQDATTRKEPPGTPSPQKDHPATKGPDPHLIQHPREHPRGPTVPTRTRWPSRVQRPYLSPSPAKWPLRPVVLRWASRTPWSPRGPPCTLRRRVPPRGFLRRGPRRAHWSLAIKSSSASGAKRVQNLRAPT